MKLLEEIPSSTTPRPSGRRVLATMTVTLLVVVGATVAGYTLLMGGGDSDEDAPVEMSSWVEQATATCVTVAEENSILTQGEDAKLAPENISDVAAGVDALVVALDDLPPLSSTDDAEQVEAAIALGTPAHEAWQELANSDDPSGGDIENASELTSTFVAGLVDLGANCAILD
ncbi:hypothetical protein [Phytoactinopolyspora endophytica]|uniref:hypothetical protein n=1 Tax=Phytoactinopolyspora endophytica TaxID=1642495 RepID=UPI00101C4F11|nr:hypothetical protein [Phytoactinopolyspora endophytica]